MCVYWAGLQHERPLHVTDLYEDIKDGVCLLSLLQVLTGEELVRAHALSWCPCLGGVMVRTLYLRSSV